jgi:hypothetical protein
LGTSFPFFKKRSSIFFKISFLASSQGFNPSLASKFKGTRRSFNPFPFLTRTFPVFSLISRSEIRMATSSLARSPACRNNETMAKERP